MPSKNLLPGLGVYFRPVDPAGEDDEHCLPLGGRIAALRDATVTVAVPGAVGVKDAPHITVPTADGKGTTKVALLKVSKACLRPTPLPSWKQDHLDFAPEEEPDVFRLVTAAAAMGSDGFETGAEAVGTKPRSTHPEAASSHEPRPGGSAQGVGLAGTAVRSIWAGLIGTPTPPQPKTKAAAAKPRDDPPDEEEEEEDLEDEDLLDAEELEEEEQDDASLPDSLAGSWAHLRPEKEAARVPVRQPNTVEGRIDARKKRDEIQRRKDDLLLRQAVASGELPVSDYLQYKSFALLAEKGWDRPKDELTDDLDKQIAGSRLVRGVQGYHAYRRSIIEAPLRYLEGFDGTMEEMGFIEDGEVISYARIGLKRIRWGRLKGLAKVWQILANILRHQKKGHHAIATAYTAAGLNAVHQAALDSGSWKVAWLLTGLRENMFARRKFAGTETQAEKMAAYLESQEKLSKLAKGTAGKEEDSDMIDTEDEDEPKGRRRNRQRPPRTNPDPKAKGKPKLKPDGTPDKP